MAKSTPENKMKARVNKLMEEYSDKGVAAATFGFGASGGADKMWPVQVKGEPRQTPFYVEVKAYTGLSALQEDALKDAARRGWYGAAVWPNKLILFEKDAAPFTYAGPPEETIPTLAQSLRLEKRDGPRPPTKLQITGSWL